MSGRIATIDGGAAMMFVGKPPWHGLGQKFESPPRTAKDAIQAAHLDWKVVKKPVYACDSDHFCKMPGYHATFRADLWGKQECRPFGLVGEDYQVFQNSEAFSFFDPLIETGELAYETAGAIGTGEQIWVLAKVKGEIVVKEEDLVEKYLLLSNGHDGHTALQIRFTPVRVVCWNTLTMALATRGDLLKAHHGLGFHRRVERTQDAVKEILGYYDKIEKQYQRFLAVTLGNEKLAKYTNLVFPEPKRKPNQKEHSFQEAVEQNKRLRETSARLSREGLGNSKPGIHGTLWAAYNGVTQLVDHHLCYDDPWRRFESICFGDGARIKQRAFDVAVEFAKN